MWRLTCFCTLHSQNLIKYEASTIFTWIGLQRDHAKVVLYLTWHYRELMMISSFNINPLQTNCSGGLEELNTEDDE